MTSSPQTVLIVDDDVPLRTAFARALDRVGYDVIAVTGSRAVLDLIDTHDPAMMLLDNHMPDASGIELIRLVRERWSPAELPIVLISGSSLQTEIDQAIEAGANDVRRKPVELGELIATVHHALERTASTDTAAPGPATEGAPT